MDVKVQSDDTCVLLDQFELWHSLLGHGIA